MANGEDHYRVAILMFDGQTVAPEDASGWSHTEYTPAQVGEAFFNDPDGVASYIAEASYGKVSFEGTVVGWIDLGSYTGEATEFVYNYENYAALAEESSTLPNTTSRTSWRSPIPKKCFRWAGASATRSLACTRWGSTT